MQIASLLLAPLAALLLAAPAPAHAGAPVRAEVRADVHWVGTGTPASCTSKAVVRAVATGGVIRFRCGPDPVTIEMRRTAKVVNTSRRVVIDGGGLVTLSGGDRRRILYQNTCDPKQVWTTSHCQDQATPRLVLRDLRLVHGDATGETIDGGGGGAVFVRGGRVRIVRSTFEDNRCDRTRTRSRRGRRPGARPSTTAGRCGWSAARSCAGVCSNGAALSSIGVSWEVRDTVFRDNRAVGRGANPERPGTPGGGSGGAIYADGNDFRVVLDGVTMTGNHAREGGGAVFFVSNDRTGTLTIDSSRLSGNPSDGFETDPGIFFLGRRQTIVDSVVE